MSKNQRVVERSYYKHNNQMLYASVEQEFFSEGKDVVFWEHLGEQSQKDLKGLQRRWCPKERTIFPYFSKGLSIKGKRCPESTAERLGEKDRTEKELHRKGQEHQEPDDTENSCFGKCLRALRV